MKIGKIIYMGTPEFAVAPLKALLDNGYNVTAVVTVPDRPKGRGLQLAESDVKKFACSKNIPVLQPEKLRDENFLKELSSFDADIFIVVAFRMLPQCVWQMPKFGTFNLHGSLLPRYRGAAPINWAIMNGEKETGVTTFFIDEQIDTGKILMQEHCPVEPRETMGTLHDKLMSMGAKLVVDTVRGLEAGTLKAVAQDDITATATTTATANSSKLEPCPAPKITKETCRIDWNRSAQQIDAQVRGLSPYPGATTVLEGEEKSIDVKIYSTDLCNETLQKKSVGSLTTDGKTYIRITCGDGNQLEVKELQMAGKKRMKTEDFLRGFRGIENYKSQLNK
jgi:methionyl-tRNA formyltransferase